MIEVLRPGLLTTVQDAGRVGLRPAGVPVGGALDLRALRLANLLVGNPPDEAGVEITLLGPRLHFREEALIALTGAEMDARLDGEPVPARRPVLLPAGAALDLGGARRGCRAYLACAGGIAVPGVLGSRGTCLVGRFGGLDGRALRSGDLLPVGPVRAASERILRSLGPGRAAPPWSLSPDLLPLPGPEVEVRLLPGAHAGLLAPESGEALLSASFRIGRDSDRMGCRLVDGPALSMSTPLELASEAVAVGTVQLPPGGAPIVLLADGGTTGGYPRIGHVASADLGILAQLRPGDSLRFRAISLEEARGALRASARETARAAHAIRLRTA